jgi:chemotaxis protein MotB
MAGEKRAVAKKGKLDPSVWMVTFSDLIMLLLTFFVMLLTMSSMDVKKLKDIIRHGSEAPGVLSFSQYTEIADLAKFIDTYSESDSKFVIDQDLLRDFLIPTIKLEGKKEEMAKLLGDMVNLVDIGDDERGIVLSFQEDILFDSGEVVLKKKELPILDSIAKAIYSCTNDILVMGHTDNVPVKSSLRMSNWELSSQRGLSVLAYLLEKGLSPSRFSVGGYGPSRPRYPNDTPKNRALNRRVEIIFRHLEGR